MRTLLHISALLLLLGTISVAQESTVEQSAVSDTSNKSEMKAWSDKLGADRFEVREAASKHLLAAGPKAISPLLDATKNGSLEARLRALDILQELALQEFNGAERVEEAIRSIAESPGSVVSQQAKQILNSMKGIRTARATKILQRLGASFGQQVESFEEQTILGGNTLSVSFGKGWRGKTEDFALLKWLGDYRGIRVRLMGSKFDDVSLKGIVRVDNLKSLELNRTKVTNEGVENVGGLSNLRIVTIRYCDQLTDDCLPHLEKLSKSLQSLTFFGQKVTKQKFDELAKRNPSWKTRYGRGGFLGIAGSRNPTGRGCQVTKVTPNHAASIAGIREYDVITAYNGKEVNHFTPPSDVDDYAPEPGEVPLSELISENLPGDRVKITIRRSGPKGIKEIVKEVTLGEWD